MKFTHILGHSSIHAIGMAGKMIRKAKEQHCKKKQFCKFYSLKCEQKILLSNSSNSAQNLICRQNSEKIGPASSELFFNFKLEDLEAFFREFCDTWSEKVERKIQFQVTLKELPKAENTFSQFR